MMNEQYIVWIQELKQKIHSAQLKASVAVNVQMLMLYWDIGKSIVEKQNQFAWGSKIVEQMAKDLKHELPDTNGFSRTNLFAMRKFYLFYKDCNDIHRFDELKETAALNPGNETSGLENKLVQQPVGQLPQESILCKIPWGHHVSLLNKCYNHNDALFYIQQTIQHNWSRNVLEIQIESKLIKRQGKALNNFELTLPKIQSDLAKETLKDPYKFDFLTLEADVQELHLEKMLTDNISKFLLELGKGFAFVGRQYPLQVGNKERKIDLLFYHLKMHCFIVIDLKMGEFEPEFAGKMNYYLSAVDKLLKTEHDNPSIGIILCKTKDRIEVEYALQDIQKPMGISEFTFNELPVDIQKNMPTIEEIEHELNVNNHE
jgi:predicted nuclease of restriction endonuclease-like (RecB) superfamily